MVDTYFKDEGSEVVQSLFIQHCLFRQLVGLLGGRHVAGLGRSVSPRGFFLLLFTVEELGGGAGEVDGTSEVLLTALGVHVLQVLLGVLLVIVSDVALQVKHKIRFPVFFGDEFADYSY